MGSVLFALFLFQAIPHEMGLSADCPENFVKAEDGRCYLDIAYQHYDVGMYGLRKAFRVTRDGLDPKSIDLGRLLFFDPILSADRDMSCAHCHHPDYGFADGRARAMGKGATGFGPDRRGGLSLARSAPSLWNVGLMQRFNWDGAVSTLEDQTQGPLFNPTEMGNTPQQLERSLNQIPAYRALFADAFPETARQGIGVAQVVQAIADFERTLISVNSRYDLYVHGVRQVLSEEEVAGMNVFRSFVTRCSECHMPPLFSNGQIAVIGVPEKVGAEFDVGAGKQVPSQRGGFRVPSLRNVALTAPYMHAGNLTDLAGVVDFYDNGGGRAFPGQNADLFLHWHIVRSRLSRQERENLVLFLKTLSDESGKPAIPLRVPSGLAVVPSRQTKETEQLPDTHGRLP